MVDRCRLPPKHPTIFPFLSLATAESVPQGKREKGKEKETYLDGEGEGRERRVIYSNIRDDDGT